MALTLLFHVPVFLTSKQILFIMSNLPGGMTGTVGAPP